jgi:hypothetical protein
VPWARQWTGQWRTSACKGVRPGQDVRFGGKGPVASGLTFLGFIQTMVWWPVRARWLEGQTLFNAKSQAIL